MLNIRPSKYCQCAKYQALSVMPTHQISGPSNHANALNIRPTESCQCAEDQALRIVPGPWSRAKVSSGHFLASNSLKISSTSSVEVQKLKKNSRQRVKQKVSTLHRGATIEVKLFSLLPIYLHKSYLFFFCLHELYSLYNVL